MIKTISFVKPAAHSFPCGRSGPPWLRPLIILVISVLGSGCGSLNNLSYLRPKLGPNELHALTLAATYQDEARIHYFMRTGVMRYRYVRRDAGSPGFQDEDQDLGEIYSTLKARRNKVINDLLFLINFYYDQYELSWYASSTGTNFVGDAAILGLNLASTAVGGTEIKTILSAISAGLGGVKIAAQRDFFRNQDVGIIVQRMRSLRSRALTALKPKMRLSIEDYPLEESLLDLQSYFSAGTVLGAIQSINDESSYMRLAGGDLLAQANRQGKNFNQPGLGKEERPSSSNISEEKRRLTEPRPSPSPKVAESSPSPSPSPSNDQVRREGLVKRIKSLAPGQASELLTELGADPASDDADARSRLKSKVMAATSEGLTELEAKLPP